MDLRPAASANWLVHDCRRLTKPYHELKSSIEKLPKRSTAKGVKTLPITVRLFLTSFTDSLLWETHLSDRQRNQHAWKAMPCVWTPGMVSTSQFVQMSHVVLFPYWYCWEKDIYAATILASWWHNQIFLVPPKLMRSQILLAAIAACACGTLAASSSSWLRQLD